MFRYSLLLDTLFKAMTHKYIRRVPKGVTKTGATKYMYFYAGQEGHGKGVAHESELVTGASFAFGEHGKTRYHAHITKVDGDKLTIKYDDGDKKGTEETMTKKQFQALVHGEHATGIKQAKEKAEKQLKDFQAGKEKGVKVKQETLDKLEQRVKNLDALTTADEEHIGQEPQEKRLGIVAQKILDEWNSKKGKKTSTINTIPRIDELLRVLYEQDKDTFLAAVYKTPAFTRYRDTSLSKDALRSVLEDEANKIMGFYVTNLISTHKEDELKKQILDAIRTGKNADQKGLSFLMQPTILDLLVTNKNLLDNKIKKFNKIALENQALSFIKQNKENYKDQVKEVDDLMNKIISFNGDYNTTDNIYNPVSLKDIEEMRRYVNDARRLLVTYDRVWNEKNIEKNDLPDMGRMATALFIRNFEQLPDHQKLLENNDSTNLLQKMQDIQLTQDSYPTSDADRLRIFLGRMENAEQFLEQQEQIKQNPNKIPTQKQNVDRVFSNLKNNIPTTKKDLDTFLTDMKKMASDLDNKEATVHFFKELTNNLTEYSKAYDKAYTLSSLQDRFRTNENKRDLKERLMKWEIKDVIASIPYLNNKYMSISDNVSFSQGIDNFLKIAQDKQDAVRKSIKFTSIANNVIKALRK